MQPLCCITIYGKQKAQLIVLLVLQLFRILVGISNPVIREHLFTLKARHCYQTYYPCVDLDIQNMQLE